MNQQQPELQELLARLAELQARFGDELESLKQQVLRLQEQSGAPEPPAASAFFNTPATPQATGPTLAAAEHTDETDPSAEIAADGKAAMLQQPGFDYQRQQAPAHSENRPAGLAALQKNPEKFIGENLISRIGALIMLIGVAFGVKYSIDNNLIGPVGRIISGYVMALALLLGAFKLKSKYHDLSAVILSAAMAMLYFVSYFAHHSYELFPRALSFVLMVSFTVFTVLSALHYNKQVIAFIGMLGAYGVPFLLSKNSGEVEVLFSYLSIVNAGIFYIALKKNWLPLFFGAMLLGWLIYFSWFFTGFSYQGHFSTALLFQNLFHALFLGFLLFGRLLKNTTLKPADAVFYLLNSLLYYCAGYTLLDFKHAAWLGAFTLACACLHFAVAKIMQKRGADNRAGLYMAMTVMLSLLAVSVAVQLDGHWVTILWSLQATLLYRFGRKRGLAVYEHLGSILLGLAALSLLGDQPQLVEYGRYHVNRDIKLFVLNANYLNALCFAACCGLCAYTHFTNKLPWKTPQQATWARVFGQLSSLAALAVFLLFSLCEIWLYWQQRGVQSMLNINGYMPGNPDMQQFGTVWMLIFTLLFGSTAAALVHYKKAPSGPTTLALLFGCAASVLYLALGLPALHNLNNSYAGYDELFHHGGFNIGIRYLSLGCLLLQLWQCWRLCVAAPRRRVMFEVASAAMLLVWLSSEVLACYRLLEWAKAAKSGWTLLWSGYALLLVAYGIYRHKKHLRLFAMLLFAVTTLKLFVYDMSGSNTLVRTLAFIAMGLLMLFCSFLYNKFKHLISDENQTN